MQEVPKDVLMFLYNIKKRKRIKTKTYVIIYNING